MPQTSQSPARRTELLLPPNSYPPDNRAGPSSLRQFRQQPGLSQFQCRNSLLPRNAPESLKKLRERIAPFKEVEKIFNGNTSAIKTRLSADSLRVNPDDAKQRMIPLNQIPAKCSGATALMFLIVGDVASVDIK